MSFMFRTAVRTETSLLIAIAGASGSGKTYSAMRLGSGLSNGKPFAVIDTESGRALHYADKFKFDHGELRAPFTPQAYTDAFQAADAAGYPAIVIDSASHEYEGEGGILEWADKLAGSMKAPKNWIEPKTAHKRMVGRMLQCRAHLIFCLRAEDKIKITKDANGKMVIIQPDAIPIRERWIPITEKRFMYEMTVSMIMTPDNPGIPVPIKIQDQHRFAFAGEKRVDEEAGKKLAEWAKGQASGVPNDTGTAERGGGNSPVTAATPQFANDDELLTAARKEAEKGKPEFLKWYRTLSETQLAVVNSIGDDLKARW